jgi:hypothetical protein
MVVSPTQPGHSHIVVMSIYSSNAPTMVSHKTDTHTPVIHSSQRQAHSSNTHVTVTTTRRWYQHVSGIVQ